MANEQGNNPTTGTQSDISKSQSQQQPNNEQRQQPETGEQNQFETGQQGQQQFGQDTAGGSPDEGLQGDTTTQQRTDIEGSSISSGQGGAAGSGFVGSQGQQDSSNQLVQEDDEDFASDGQGAPEGK